MGRPPIETAATAAALAAALRRHLPRPAAVVGVGNALRGDDAFGPSVVARLAGAPGLVLFDVQAVPESFLVPIARSGCRGVLFVDAAELGLAPGSVALAPEEALAEVDVSTHAISLGLVAEAVRRLAAEMAGAELTCALVAAQPAALDEADRMSPSMGAAVGLAAAGIRAFAARRAG